MLLPLAPSLQGPGGTSCPEACSTTPYNSANSGVILLIIEDPLCLTHCSLTPSKWRKIFLTHTKNQALSFFKDPNSLVAMNRSVMSHYEIYRVAFYPGTIKTFITGLPLCEIPWCIEQLHIVTHKKILRMFFLVIQY